MSQKSFAELGLSQPVVGALADRGMTSPFAIQALVIEDVLEGRRRPRQVPHGLGQDDRLRRADHRRARPDGAQAHRARARPDA